MPLARNFAASMISIVLLLSIPSCVDLGHIEGFSKTSATSLQSYDDLELSFTSICQHYVREVLEYRANETDHKPAFIFKCDPEKSSDSALNTLNTLLVHYFLALEKLSSRDLVGYKIDGLADGVNALGKAANWKISESQITSSKNILSILINDILDIHSKHQLKHYLTTYKSQVNDAFEAYEMGLNALHDYIGHSIENYKGFYTDPLLDKTRDLSVKALIMKDYDHATNKLLAVQSKISKYIELVDKIKKDYADLANHASSLTTKEVKSLLEKYGSDLQKIKSEYENLKKN